MEEKTKELISITFIKDIFKNNNLSDDLVKYILNGKEKFFGVDIFSLVSALNEYFKFYLNNYKEDINYICYKKINKINNVSKINIIYNLPSDEKSSKIISLMYIVNKILEDDEFFQTFIESSSEIFFGFEVDLIIIEIKKTFNMLKSNTIVLDTMINKYKKIVFLKDKELLNEVKTIDSNEVINPKIEYSILSKVNFNNDKLTIAMEIYILLAKLVKYDEEFIFYEKNSKKEFNIYNKNIYNITINNNEVTCFSWSKMYSYLLNKIGIESVISGNYHKYVIFKTEDLLIKADAINYSVVNNKMRTNDLFNVRTDLPLVGFSSLSNNCEFDEKLLQSNKILESQNKVNQKTLKILEKLYGEEEYYTMQEGLDYMQNIKIDNLSGIELAAYYSKISKKIFSNKKYIVKNEYILEKKMNTKIKNIITINCGVELLILSCEKNKIKIIDKEKYNKLLNNKNVIFYNSDDKYNMEEKNARRNQKKM